ncbi:MAG TPA: ComEA family DNA-binding protein [Acidimicrobiales bacterium]
MPELLRPEPPRSWPERLHAVRAAIDPARAAVTVGVVLLLTVAGWWLVRPSPLPVEAGLPRASSAPGVVTGAPPPSVAAPPGSPPVMVQVAGAVASPGVYRLAPDARIVDLVAAAGGALPDADLEAMALATRLSDGQRVQVPHRGEVLPAEATGGGGAMTASTGPTGSAGPAQSVDLNQATLAELDALPGVGPTTAQAIVTYRDKHGPFLTVDDLTEVQGIGPTRLEHLRDLVHV